MSDLIVRTISDFSDYICGEPMSDDLFTVWSSQKEEEVFKGTWDELLESEYAYIELASWDLHPEPDVIICFNLEDEDYEYDEDEDEEEDEEDLEEEEYEEAEFYDCHGNWDPIKREED